MSDSLFAGLFEVGSSSITLSSFLISLAAALVLGFLLAVVYMQQKRYTSSLVFTLAILPAIVCVIIMMVSGSLGASVAVAGTFSLVRFRSNPGTAREIGLVFLAMAIGLACGLGYPVFAALFAVILCVMILIYDRIGFGTKKDSLARVLQITIPEDLNYGDMFDDLFETYTTYAKMRRVKTTNLGSLNRVTYDISLKDAGKEKQFIDDLRVRNGNLEITLAAVTEDDSLL